MDIKTVAKLAEIIDKYGLTKIDITDTSVRYLLERECASPVQAAAAVPSPTPAAPADESAAEEPRLRKRNGAEILPCRHGVPRSAGRTRSVRFRRLRG